MSDMIFKGKIDETEVGRIKEGMPLTLTIGALQDMKFNAILEYIRIYFSQKYRGEWRDFI